VRLVLLLLCALLSGGCATRYVVGAAGPQAYYQTAWPMHDVSRDLESAFRSVKRIQSTGYYDTFRFGIQDSVTREALRLPATYRRALERSTFEHTKAGTATAIARHGRNMRFITNAHVPRMPDTVISYFDAPAGRPRHVESVAILRTQTNIIVGVPGASQFRVTASDSASDLALLGVEVDGSMLPGVPVLRIRAGDPARLSWGSFVYVLGYPRGYMMVTRAIVSNPGQGRDDSFLLDGLFNRGISGGLVLAVRGDTGELEWVGLANAASAQSELVLVPERRTVYEQGILLPYEGRLFVEEIRRIDYGITFTVPMAAIERFLRTAGYPLP
jgi:hypothetical protein